MVQTPWLSPLLFPLRHCLPASRPGQQVGSELAKLGTGCSQEEVALSWVWVGPSSRHSISEGDNPSCGACYEAGHDLGGGHQEAVLGLWTHGTCQDLEAQNPAVPTLHGASTYLPPSPLHCPVQRNCVCVWGGVSVCVGHTGAASQQALSTLQRISGSLIHPICIRTPYPPLLSDLRLHLFFQKAQAGHPSGGPVQSC